VRPGDVGDWLADETVHRWLDDWNVPLCNHGYGERPVEIVAHPAKGGEIINTHHIHGWEAIKAACALAIAHGRWRDPLSANVPVSNSAGS
jgi:hypothetical protein